MAGDYNAVATWLPDAAATLRWAGPNVVFPFDAVQLPSQVQVPGGTSYVLCEGSECVAFGQHWVLKPQSVHLGRLVVAPSHRGKGLGRELCRQLITAAVTSTKARSVTLRVYKDNQVAQSLYASLGFECEAEESDGQVLFMRRNEV